MSQMDLSSEETQAVFLGNQDPAFLEVLGPLPRDVKPHLSLLDSPLFHEALERGFGLPIFPDAAVPDQHLGRQVRKLCPGGRDGLAVGPFSVFFHLAGWARVILVRQVTREVHVVWREEV